MDGLDDQAEAEAEGIIDQLYTSHTVQIKHSSRDGLMIRVTAAIQEHPDRIVAKRLILRSGISNLGLRRLEEALKRLNDAKTNDGNHPCSALEELEFVSIQRIEILERAILCARRLKIPNLRLTTYATRLLRISREAVSLTIRSALLKPENQTDAEVPLMTTNQSKYLKSLSITSYPIGAEGSQILAEAVSQYGALKTFKLVDCDIRSDSATAIAQMIRTNPSLEEIDLSYNRHFPGSGITRDMTMKTLVRRGLVHNTTLMEFKIEQTQGATPVKRSKIDKQLDISRFLHRNYLRGRRDPMAVHPHLYSHVLGRVSAKPSVLYFFLQESIPTLFPFY